MIRTSVGEQEPRTVSVFGAGRIHFLERPDREPEPVLSMTAGVVCVVRAIATTNQGDNVVVVAREADRSELQ